MTAEKPEPLEENAEARRSIVFVALTAGLLVVLILFAVAVDRLLPA